MMERKNALRMAWLPALTLVFALGCGGGDEAASGDAGGDTAATTGGAAAPQPREIEDGRRTIEVPDGAGGTVKAEVAKGEVPENLPSDIPTFPGAEPATSMVIPGKGGLVTFSSSAAVEDIISFYKEELPSNGWATPNVTQNDLRTRISTVKDGRKTDVIVNRSGDSSEIMISLQESS